MAIQHYPDNLESERLLTRKLKADDSIIWADFFSDKEAVEYFPNSLSSNEERAKQWIDKQLARYRENKFGLQALIDKKSQAFVGQCGILKQEVDGIEEIEVGYHIFKKYWGQGFAPEAARLFINFAFSNNLTSSIISIIDINNIKSQRVAAKNFLQREKQTVWNEREVYIYRISKDKWIQLKRSTP